MQVALLRPGDALFPAALRQPPAPRTDSLAVSGNTGLLTRTAVGLFCSVKCPGDLILKTYDLARSLRDAGATVIGGFHSPMEKECLTILLRGTQPVIICPARGLQSARLPAAWKGPFAEGRLLLLSPFDEACRRVTEQTAEARNNCVMRLADKVLITYATQGGRLEGRCRQAIQLGKNVLTFDHPDNQNLFAMGVRPIPEPFDHFVAQYG